MSSPKDRTIYVSNIPSHLPEPVIQAFFQSCGTITNLKLAGSTEQPTRYAFVEFADHKAAATAITLSGTEIEGRKWKVTPSHSAITSPPSVNLRDGTYMPPSYANHSSGTNGSSTRANHQVESNRDNTDQIERTIYITSIDTQISQQQLVDVFSYCGHITNHKICGDDSHPTRFAFVEFSTKEAVLEAIRMNGTSLGRYSIKVSRSRAPIQPGIASASSKNINYNTPHYQDQIARTVYVGSVDVSVTEDDLQEFFQQACGSVVKVALAGDSDHSARFAFVEFATPDSRNKALTLSGTKLADKAIRVNASRTPILSGGKSYLGIEHSSNAMPSDHQYNNDSQGEHQSGGSYVHEAPEDVDDPWAAPSENNSLKRKRSYDEEEEHSEGMKRARYDDDF